MIQSLIGPIAALLDKVIPDAGERAKLAHEIATMSERHAQEIALAQIGVNKEEAKSAHWFVSSWRPAVGWVCVCGLIYNFIIYPMMLWCVAAFGLGFTPPPLLSENLMELVLGMLGLSALRTAEKWKGVAR